MTIIEAIKQVRDDILKWGTNNFNAKLNKNLGTDHSEEFLVTDAKGEVTTIDLATETLTFVLEDGSTLTKDFYVYKPPVAVLTLQTSTTKMTDVIINGKEYSEDKTLEVPIGTIVTCKVENEADYYTAYILLNGEQVYSTPNSGSYDYTVTGNATISSKFKSDVNNDNYGVIEITEAQS
jgi:hypothetical protein